ncbi:MAG: helix-turn-helix domain-containing protein [Ignavibacteriaceae bacterium]|nr:helix-turn-helix domain-containing protein [Ignavibacteriaceae bacterium]
MNTLKETRERMQLTQEEVAKMAGFSLKLYQSFEDDKRVPNVLEALRIASALNKSVDDIFIEDNTFRSQFKA